MGRSKVADLLERLTRLVPGISGYQDREKRRTADKAIRERAAAAVGSAVLLPLLQNYRPGCQVDEGCEEIGRSFSDRLRGESKDQAC